MKRRVFIGSAASCAIFSHAGLSLAAESIDSYPSRPIRLICPNPAGGGFDMVGRQFAEKLSASWRQPVIVENRAGAAGMIATAAVAKAPGDGYTILMGSSGIALNPVIFASMPYKPSEIAAVAKMHDIPFVFVVNKSLGASTLREFIQLAKGKPDISYGSIAISTNALGETLRRDAGLDLIRVPYRGEQPAIADLLGGQVTSMFGAVGSATRYPDKLVALAITGNKRFPGLNVPTFAELGLPRLSFVSWGGIFAASSTPPPLVDKLSREFARIGALPEIVERTLSAGFIPSVTDAQEFARLIQSETQYWERTVAEFKLTAE